MNNIKPLMICLACSVFLPVLATGEYSSPRPKSEMEDAPAAMSGAQSVEKTLTVQEVDQASRLIALKDPEGNMVTVKASDQVKNLGQIKPGDRVNVSYYQSMAVDLVLPGEERPTEVSTTQSSAKPGMAPAGTMTRQASKTVEILSVDPYKKAIAFRDVDGRWREVSVNKPELQHFLTDLKKGDKVQVTSTEALAVSVQPR